MSAISKLLGVATLGSTLASVALLRRFLSGVTSVVALVIVTAIMGCVLLLGALGAAYLGLVHYGLDPYVAALTVAAFMFLVVATLMGFTIIRLRHLRELPYHDLHPEIPNLSRISDIANAFMDGLLNHTPSSRK